MPSWRVHKVLSGVVYGRHTPDVDVLADTHEGHDAGRYRADILLEHIDQVRLRYGDVGLCCYVPHHFLDRLVDIVVSELSTILDRAIYRIGLPSYEEFRYNILKRLKYDAKNLLALILVANSEADLDKVFTFSALYYSRSVKKRLRERGIISRSLGILLGKAQSTCCLDLRYRTYF